MSTQPLSHNGEAKQGLSKDTRVWNRLTVQLSSMSSKGSEDMAIRTTTTLREMKKHSAG